jgi:hypothetical protein
MNPKQILIKIVFVLVKLSNTRLRAPSATKTAQLSDIESFLLGIGLVFVLFTPPSRSLSQISLITQPADLTKILPIIIINK